MFSQLSAKFAMQQLQKCQLISAQIMATTMGTLHTVLAITDSTRNKKHCSVAYLYLAQIWCKCPQS